MSKDAHPQHLQAMIDRAGALSVAEAEALGRVWKGEEDLAFPEPSLALGIVGEVDVPAATNEQLLAAWQHALDAAGSAGRVDEIEAAEVAGRAAKRDLRHSHDDAYAKDGAEEAVRSAVLAAGVRDLVSDEDFATLTLAWRRVMGDIPA